MRAKLLVLFLLIGNAFKGQYFKQFVQDSYNNPAEAKIEFEYDEDGNFVVFKTLPTVFVGKNWDSYLSNANNASWTRLRNAVYVTYPYARRAGEILNEINFKLSGVTDKEERRKIIKEREDDLRKQFTKPLSDLSIYQGKVMMKLINRQTGNSCFEIIKEFKGGALATLYQGVALVCGTNLKQNFDATNYKDIELERITEEVERMYGYR